jgi:hypothetical protein
MALCVAAKWAVHVRCGSKADKPSQAKIQECPLWSESGQKRARPECPLSANRDQRTAASSIAIRSLAGSPEPGLSLELVPEICTGR